MWSQGESEYEEVKEVEEQSTRRNSKTLASETLLGWTLHPTIYVFTMNPLRWRWCRAGSRCGGGVATTQKKPPRFPGLLLLISFSMLYSTLNWSRYLISQFVQLLLLLVSILYLNSLLAYPRRCRCHTNDWPDLKRIYFVIIKEFWRTCF